MVSGAAAASSRTRYTAPSAASHGCRSLPSRDRRQCGGPLPRESCTLEMCPSMYTAAEQSHPVTSGHVELYLWNPSSMQQPAGSRDIADVLNRRAGFLPPP